MKEISLTRGLVTLVDDEDYELLSAHKWYAQKIGERFYAARNLRMPLRSVPVRMHRVLCAAPPGMQVDHANGDSLDNRRANLRIATAAQNIRNRGINKNNRSGYKGVCWDMGTGLWRAAIMVNRRRKSLGYFDSPLEAHAAYRAAAQELHQEFARFA